MNEIIKDYIHETSCKIIVNKLQKVLTYVICWQMDEMPLWQFVCHVGMCVGIWHGISCKEIVYNYMWVASHIQYCIQHRVSIATVAICPITLKVV
jgi:hypothetical protein